MSISTLEELFIHELKDLYSAEKQLTKALPKMAKAARNPSLRAGFEEHLQQTEVHVQRLEQIFEELGEKPGRMKCQAMEGLIEEGKSLIDEKPEPMVGDAGLFCAAQKVEHYEIASYGTVKTFARILGHTNAENLLGETLEEEKETDRKLTELAESEINVEANEGEELEEDEMEREEETPARRPRKKAPARSR